MPEINQFTQVFRGTKRAQGDTSAPVRLACDPVKAHTLRVLTHTSTEDRTNSFTLIRIGIHNRGVDYYLDELKTIAANELCVSTYDILLGDGDFFFAELTGTTDDDDLILTVVGWEIKL